MYVTSRVTNIVQLRDVVVLETLQIDGDQPVRVHTQDSEPWGQGGEGWGGHYKV